MSATIGEKDRISALPDDILFHIMRFMPIESAVQTSIFSNRWQHLWKFNPVLDFYSLPSSRSKPLDFNIINRILSLYKAPTVLKFIIKGHVGVASFPDVNYWVNFATARNIQELYLCFINQQSSRRVFDLPGSLYVAQSVSHMFLRCVNFSTPLGFTGLANLRKLVLFKSMLNDETVQSLISTCLHLETLLIVECWGLANANISGPQLGLKNFVFRVKDVVQLEISELNLVSFVYSGSLRCIRLNDLTCLVEASLFDGEINDTNIGYARALMGELARVKHLSVNSWFSQFMAKEHYMNGSRCTQFQRLEKFCWFGPLETESNLVTLVAFLRDCPSLQTIEIDFRVYIFAGAGQITHRVPTFVELKGGDGRRVDVGFLYKLRTIKVVNFSGFKGEMELVKRLLQKALVLQKLSLTFRLAGYCVTGNETQREFLQEQVSRFPRASFRAQVLFD